MTEPNFFLIGAGKAGTTSLARHLDGHPDIFVCKPKEPRFLCYPDGRPQFKGPSDDRLFVPESRQAYRDLFKSAKNTAVVGDASTWYLTHPEAPAHIQTHYPNAKIVAVLRNPCERSFSHWMHLIREQVEPVSDFIEACEAEKDRKSKGYAPHWWYLTQSLYAEGLQRYFDRFPREQIQVHLYDDFVADPMKVISETYQFLGVSADHHPNTKEKLNIGGIPRNKSLQRYLERSAWGGNDPFRPLKLLFPKRFRSTMRRKIEEANLITDRHLTSKERTYLLQKFDDDVRSLETMIGRDLSIWRGQSGTSLDTSRCKEAAA